MTTISAAQVKELREKNWFRFDGLQKSLGGCGW